MHSTLYVWSHIRTQTPMDSCCVCFQDPVIFSGSLRLNLDPLDQHSEEDLWRALEMAHLKHFVASMPHGLNYHCGENGEALR